MTGLVSVFGAADEVTVQRPWSSASGARSLEQALAALNRLRTDAQQLSGLDEEPDAEDDGLLEAIGRIAEDADLKIDLIGRGSFAGPYDELTRRASLSAHGGFASVVDWIARLGAANPSVALDAIRIERKPDPPLAGRSYDAGDVSIAADVRAADGATVMATSNAEATGGAHPGVVLLADPFDLRGVATTRVAGVIRGTGRSVELFVDQEPAAGESTKHVVSGTASAEEVY